MRNIFKHCRQTTELIKSTYNQAFASNFQKYLLKDEKNSWPEPKINNIVMFTKNNSLLFGAISNILGDQLEIDANNIKYVRPKSETYHVVSS